MSQCNCPTCTSFREETAQDIAFLTGIYDDFLADENVTLETAAPREEDEHDFLVTATVQVIVPARNRVEARALVSDVIKGLLECSPFPGEPMQGYTVDSVEIENEDIEDLTAGYDGVEEL